MQENAVICNNRFNDYTHNSIYPIKDDSYNQPGYLIANNSNGTDTILDGTKTPFDYSAHYGITVNRFMTNFDYINGEIKGNFANISLIDGYATTPDKTPALFAKGVEIQDNFIYNTLRVALFVSGQG